MMMMAVRCSNIVLCVCVSDDAFDAAWLKTWHQLKLGKCTTSCRENAYSSHLHILRISRCTVENPREGETANALA